MVSGTILTDKTGTVKAKHDSQILKSHIMDDLVKSSLKERRIYR